ncbi:P-loop containing nucleoside triphosphate hydrolase protein [Daedaleopsis nitida]|nr:P-loop containing nucleoside triphosphate hydrolase protein [Daedaleopsis nitida]
MMSTAQPTLINTDYGKSSKELIEFVGQLRALGAHIDLELPRIVVIGNQSAGKSSLVEAISGISVPRDAGTCTRCPMECRLAHSPGEWSCQIKIRWEYKSDNKERREEVEEVDFGPLLTDKGDVEPMLRRAQAAVLNPDVPCATFANMSDAQFQAGAHTKGKKQLLFSRNIVCIELTGPDLADLSFVDLPGIVQNAEAEVVQLVEDLVKSYIHGNSLILVTLPMSDDIENQKAARLAKEADPKGLRTIGVMTKPDTLTAGSTKARNMWLEVLEGRRHPLLHGYFCTRQPDDDERSRGISAAAAREAELKFFQSTTPWATSGHQHRFGTTNLVQNISKLLTNIIREALPGLLEQVAAQLESCNSQLVKLPPPVTIEAAAFVFNLVSDFCNDLTQRVRGSPAHTELVQSTRRMYDGFKTTIRSSAPPFVPYKDAAHAPKDITEYIRVDSNDRKARGKTYTGQVVYLDDVRAHIRACMTRELPGNVPYAAKLALFQAFQHSWEQSALGCFVEVQDVFKERIAVLVREYFERYANLKAIVGPATMELMKTCAERTASQLRVVLELETSPFTQNNHYFVECRDKWLAKYKDARAGKGPAERVTPASVAATQVFTFGAPTTPARAPPSSGPPTKKARTTSGPRAANTSSPSSSEQEDAASSSEEEASSSEEESSSYEDASRKAPAPAPPTTSATNDFTFTSTAPAKALSPEEQEKRDELLKQTLANLANLGYMGLHAEDLGKLNPADIYEDELEVMAEVRAYFQVAYKRVIDYIPLSIDHHFLYAFVKGLQQTLFERLGLGTPTSAARCSAYIAEDPTVAALRDELMSKKKRLENVQRALYNFGL